MEVLFPKTRLAAEGPTWEEDPPRSLGGETPEITTQEREKGGEMDKPEHLSKRRLLC
jgi:hypothetical protein